METKTVTDEEKQHGFANNPSGDSFRRLDIYGPVLPERYEISPRLSRSSDETLSRIQALESQLFEIHQVCSRQLSEIKDDKQRDAVLVRRELAIIYTASYLLVGWFLGHFVGWIIHDPFPMPKEFIAFICVGFGGGVLRLIQPYLKR